MRYLRMEHGAFARGFRRAIQQDRLLVEREQSDGRMVDQGSIPNRVQLSLDPGHAQCAQALGYGVVLPDSAHGSWQAPDSVILVRTSRWWSEHVDSFQGRGSPGPNAKNLNEDIDATGVIVRVAVCAPHTLVELPDSVWVPMSVRWRQRSADGIRALEIHGWMVGMATLQLIHQRAGWMESDLELVFESRGRNR